MKTYRQHRCDRRHRSYRTFAECAWKKRGILTQVIGDGGFASVSRCADNYSLPSYRRTITVHLFASEREAVEAKDLIDRTACGGNCVRNHEVIRLELPA